MSTPASAAPSLRLAPRLSAPRLRRFAAEAVWWVLSVGIVVGIWEVTAALGLINTIILPPPHKFVAEIMDQSQFLMPQPGVSAIPLHFAVFTAIGASLRRVLVGLVLGSSAAVLTGSLAFYLRIFRNLTFPTITMLAPIAPAAWIPLAILAFGMGDGAAIFVVFVGIYFTLTLATLNNEQRRPGVRQHRSCSEPVADNHVACLPAILPNLRRAAANFFAAWMGCWRRRWWVCGRDWAPRRDGAADDEHEPHVSRHGDHRARRLPARRGTGNPPEARDLVEERRPRLTRQGGSGG
jgi:NitT/TauT family transport system permease protein